MVLCNCNIQTCGKNITKEKCNYVIKAHTCSGIMLAHVHGMEL